MRISRWHVASVAVAFTAALFTFAPAAQAGSICRDGTWTASEGRGTCSGHGGVAKSGVDDPGGREVIGSGSSESTSSTGSSNNLNSGYGRSLFKHWTRQTNGCTTREVVLIRQAKGGYRSGCRMIGATWYSKYDGATTTNPSAFDTDHVVPLAEAWRSGAKTWSPAKREAFANDLGWANSLIAVSAASNRAKGDRDPADWLPTRRKDRCRYVQVWVGVKHRWGLSMDKGEKAAVDRTLQGCKIKKKLTNPPLAK